MIKKSKSSIPLSACTVIVFSNQELYARPLVFSKNVSLSNLCSSILNQNYFVNSGKGTCFIHCASSSA